MTYAEKLKDPRWQKCRLAVFHRDNFTCRDCNDTESTLHVHHCLYAKGDPWETPLHLLLTLCYKCHERRQALEDAIKADMGLLFSEMAPADLEAMATSSKEEANWKSTDAIVKSASMISHQAEWPWFMEACHNPAVRAAFESIYGYKPNWDRINQAEGE